MAARRGLGSRVIGRQRNDPNAWGGSFPRRAAQHATRSGDSPHRTAPNHDRPGTGRRSSVHHARTTAWWPGTSRAGPGSGPRTGRTGRAAWSPRACPKTRAHRPAEGVDGVAGEPVGRDPADPGQSVHPDGSREGVVRAVPAAEGAARAPPPGPDGSVPDEGMGHVRPAARAASPRRRTAEGATAARHTRDAHRPRASCRRPGPVVRGERSGIRSGARSRTRTGTPAQGQRGLSSPCLHSTIRAGQGLRVAILSLSVALPLTVTGGADLVLFYWRLMVHQDHEVAASTCRQPCV